MREFCAAELQRTRPSGAEFGSVKLESELRSDSYHRTAMNETDPRALVQELRSRLDDARRFL